MAPAYLVGVCGWQKMTPVQLLRFLVWFWFYKINHGFVFSVRFLQCVLFSTVYDARNVVPCWIGPTNCQPKWLRTRSAEIWHEEKYFDCWSYHAARWTVNETTWKTVPNCQNWFFENRTTETEFSVFEFWRRFSSAFRKLISDIFIGFRTPLVLGQQYHSVAHCLLELLCDCHICLTVNVKA